MYAQGSQESLRNAEHLFEDAMTLSRNKSFGSAQTLIVTAIEEAAKAIILELTNLNYFGKEVAEQSMRVHPPKKLVLFAMEKGLLFVDQIDRRDGRSVIDNTRIEELEKRFKVDLRDMENRRQNGFYVKVDINNGAILNSPNNVKKSETGEFAKRAESFLKLCKTLCGIFREYRVVDRNTFRNNLRIFQEDMQNIYASYDEV